MPVGEEEGSMQGLPQRPGTSLADTFLGTSLHQGLRQKEVGGLSRTLFQALAVTGLLCNSLYSLAKFHFLSFPFNY